MKAPSLSSVVLRRWGTSASWTCAKCRHQLGRTSAPRFPSTRQYSTSRQSVPKHKAQPARARVVILAASGAAGAGVLAFTDDIKYSYDAAERTGRVGVALAVCVSDYQKTLKKREALEDEEEKARILSDCHKRCAVRTLKVLEKNGGIFIKLGQHLSAMNYLLPPEWTTTFIPLQDRCPVSSLQSIEDMFKQDTGEELSDYFTDFSADPIGAASLAQVHIATIKETGQKVAVKVQHPGLAQWAPLDTALTKFTFSTLKRFFPEYDLEWLSSEMEVSLPQELDFQCEAHNAMRTKEHFSHFSQIPLVIPDVIWAKKRILVMACESGHRLDDLEYLDSNGIDRDEVSATLAHIFNEMIFGEGAPLHCDPHGGNIAIRKNPRRRGANFDVILYDHGLYRDIPMDLRRSYAKMWLAVIDGDMEQMKKHVREVAGVDDEQFPLFASAITGRDFSVVSSSIMKPRTEDERGNMSGQLQEGLLADLIGMLGQVPRIILLILKTNDLTRSLDENLHTRQGPIRNFLILARYCMRTVFREQLEEIQKNGSFLWPPNTVRLVAASWSFLRVEIKLKAFELWLSIKRIIGLQRAEVF
ncbi:ABC1 family protein MCP2 [Pleurostoma richardsiae]|uniref:ABC1 family protein MCP2 n=1 Tax=Pleurostoma richardsiae TaxID=41990 RepID=A0AA38VPT3_9PEZI|nr:ABC1 family protein MCP2 [Pleurostoma richardsiae]